MIEKRKYTRNEIAELLGKTRSWVSALCSPTKMNLVADEDNPELIDLEFPKNYSFIMKRFSKLNPSDNTDKKPTSKKLNLTEIKSNIEDAESEDSESEPTHESPLVEKLSRQFKANIKKSNGVSDYKESLFAMDEAKLKKIQMEAELKELELKQRRGELVPSGEVVPFVHKLSKTRDDLLRTEIMSSIRDFIAEFELPPEFLGRFEREFIMLLNETNQKAIKMFEVDVKPVVNGI